MLVGVSLCGAVSAHAEGLLLAEGSKWLVIASRETFEGARSFATSYENAPEGVRIIRSKNGRFAVVLGPTRRMDIERIKAEGTIPGDSFLSAGANFLETVWVKTYTDPVQANPQPNHYACVSIEAAVERLACHDSLNGRSIAASSAAAPSPSVQALQAVTSFAPQRASYESGGTVSQVNAEMRTRSQDIMNDIAYDRIELKLAYRNDTAKTVVGIVHGYKVTNVFGETIVTGQDNLDIRIEPHSTVASDTYYYWNDNPFITGEPYDRLAGPVSNGTWKVEDTVQKVFFADGSSDVVASN